MNQTKKPTSEHTRERKVDEHGNPMGTMYRIKFPDDQTESYFYTEQTYRVLSRERDELREQVKRMQAAVDRAAEVLEMLEYDPEVENLSGYPLEETRDEALAKLKGVS